jgi:hypothetical protein
MLTEPKYHADDDLAWEQCLEEAQDELNEMDQNEVLTLADYLHFDIDYPIDQEDLLTAYAQLLYDLRADAGMDCND